MVDRKGRDESAEGSGVYDEKQKTRTEPWGTLQEDEYKKDRQLSHLTQKYQDDR